MQLTETDGVALHWREDGDPAGPALVFANSLGTDLRLWDAILPLIPPQYRIIRFDKRGHGLSACPPPPYTMRELVEDAEGLLDAVGVQRCIFVGLSIGGMIGQGLAAKRPDLVSALVLSNTAAKMGSAEIWAERIGQIEADGLAAIAEGVMARWFAAEFLKRPELALWQAMLSRTPAAGYIGCARAIAAADLSEGTAGLRLPCLAIAGSDDGSSPPDQVAAMAEMIPGARFECIDGAGHLPCVERPDAYAALLCNFLAELDP